MLDLAISSRPTSRVFKTAGFAKTSKKTRISDEELCQAIQQSWAGQVDDLGGGKFWLYEYLFAKKDRTNIDADELLAFRLLAKSYAGLTDNQASQLLADGDFVEICHDDENKI
ncbi:MAG: type II toxin-antitoxin system RelE/ParE family toxin [Rhodoferax sp.]|nr:type II toxin-antitoxin system RelE/ParE family toxin [Rhodoferax sp.]